MGAIHLAIIINFYDTNIDLGHLLQKSLEWLMMELGMPNNHFEYKYKKYSYAVTKS